MKKEYIIIIILVAVVSSFGTYIFLQIGSSKVIDKTTVNSFEECVIAGGFISENQPQQCVFNKKIFVDQSSEIDSEAESPLTDEKRLIGGDRDEQGCLIAAGYTWCEAKNKCLRAWEEECEDMTEKEVTLALAQKHNKNVADVNIDIEKKEGNYIKGMVQFEPSSEVGNAGMFLAAKIDGNWMIIYDGHGVVDCKDLKDNYGFPASVLVGMCD